MTTAIPDLWSPDIRVDTIGPLAILKQQAAFLEKRTHSLLKPEVIRAEEEQRIDFYFDLVAPSLDNTRERILLASHIVGRVYPVEVVAESLRPAPARPDFRISKSHETFVPILGQGKRANSQEEFIQLLGEVLKSSPVRSAIESLIARINEQLRNGEPGGSGTPI